jgi:ketosteroid isomerase-like protein
VTDLQKSIDRILDSYKSAVLARDAEAFMRLYDPDARVFDAWGVWLYAGAAAWQTAIEGWFSSLGTERVQVRFDDVQSSSDRDMAMVSAIVTYAGVAADGAPVRTLQNRLTWVLRTRGHVLRIVHEHTSAPIGFDDSKAILQRSP